MSEIEPAQPPLEPRPVQSLTRLERKWLKRRYCGFCEASLMGKSCFALSGEYALPVIEGVRDQEEIVNLGPPCDMDMKRAQALTFYKPRPRLPSRLNGEVG